MSPGHPTTATGKCPGRHRTRWRVCSPPPAGGGARACRRPLPQETKTSSDSRQGAGSDAEFTAGESPLSQATPAAVRPQPSAAARGHLGDHAHGRHPRRSNPGRPCQRPPRGVTSYALGDAIRWRRRATCRQAEPPGGAATDRVTPDKVATKQGNYPPKPPPRHDDPGKPRRAGSPARGDALQDRD
jgi:hypothetical protein